MMAALHRDRRPYARPSRRKDLARVWVARRAGAPAAGPEPSPEPEPESFAGWAFANAPNLGSGSFNMGVSLTNKATAEGGVPLEVVALGCYLPAARTHDITLWADGNTTPLQTVSISSVANEWAWVDLPAPQPWAVGAKMIVTVQFASQSYYGAPQSQVAPTLDGHVKELAARWASGSALAYPSSINSTVVYGLTNLKAVEA